MAERILSLPLSSNDQYAIIQTFFYVYRFRIYNTKLKPHRAENNAQHACYIPHTCIKIRKLRECENQGHAETLISASVIFFILSLRKMVSS